MGGIRLSLADMRCVCGMESWFGVVVIGKGVNWGEEVRCGNSMSGLTRLTLSRKPNKYRATACTVCCTDLYCHNNPHKRARSKNAYPLVQTLITVADAGASGKKNACENNQNETHFALRVHSLLLVVQSFFFVKAEISQELLGGNNPSIGPCSQSASNQIMSNTQPIFTIPFHQFETT